MNIVKHDNLYFVGPSLFIGGALIISDIHIGYEEMLAKKGILFPRVGYKEIKRKTEQIIKKVEQEIGKIKIIIINGDLKHEFGEISKQEWREVIDYVSYLNKIAKVVVVKGNHDTIIKPLKKKVDFELVNYIKWKDVLVVHGHKAIEEELLKEIKDKDIKYIIIGHEHAALGIRYDERIEKYKAFIIAPYKRIKNKLRWVVIMPSFFPLVVGNDLLQEYPLSPIVRELNIEKGLAFVISPNDDVLPLGKLKDLLKIMKL